MLDPFDDDIKKVKAMVKKASKWVGLGIGAIFVFYISSFFWSPLYNVWQLGLVGKAELKRAEWNRKIAIQEAAAKFESAKHLAAAEVERAKGVAEANRIIGESLRGNEAYLRYLWIHGLQESDSDVIYVPTEANLPILEASRLK